MRTKRLFIVSIISCVVACIVETSSSAPTRAQRCEAAIELAAAKYAQCRLTVESKFTETSEASKLAKLATCSYRFAGVYERAFQSWGTDCSVGAPESDLQFYLARCTSETEGAASGESFPSGCPEGFPATGQTTCRDLGGSSVPCSGTGQDGETQTGRPLIYVDNGDGTISDPNTGLMWEKLSDDGSIHDFNDVFTWDDARAVKIASLNASNFAGYRDWRLPNVKELISIVNYENNAPAISSEFNAECSPGCSALTCSCTSLAAYWTSTSYVNGAGYSTDWSWFVVFGSGRADAFQASLGLHARAVRGGSPQRALAEINGKECEAAVELAAGKYAQCRLKAEATFTRTGDAPRRTDSLADCSEKFRARHNRTLAIWGGGCPTTEPSSAFEAHLDLCTSEVASVAAGGAVPNECVGKEFPAAGRTWCWDGRGQSTSCPYGHDGEIGQGARLAFTDNGNGTVTDRNTGLVWEKLSRDAGIHDLRNQYSWTDAISVKVAALNSEGFGGHTDWRLPNVKELQSIMQYHAYPYSQGPGPIFAQNCFSECTVSSCSCTALGPYWSSTNAHAPNIAWQVNLFLGHVSREGDAEGSAYVRAVRGP